jgi:hypothetical protein
MTTATARHLQPLAPSVLLPAHRSPPAAAVPAIRLAFTSIAALIPRPQAPPGCRRAAPLPHRISADLLGNPGPENCPEL